MHFRFLFVKTRRALSLQAIATKRTIINGELIFQLFLSVFLSQINASNLNTMESFDMKQLNVHKVTLLSLIPLFPIKRLTDILISGMLIILCIPVFIFIFVVMSINMIICPEDRGRFFFREKRISRGKPFSILKFRMVKQNIAEKAIQTGTCIRDFEDNLDQLTWTGKKILKNRYMDELPQLFNIFKGDMSLVGPRPLAIPLVNAQINNGIFFRNQIIAGWTSIGQIQYKGVIIDSSCNREDLDQQYVDFCKSHNQWQIWCFDMWVLFRTIRVLIEGKGI